jgi:hypothetical protein
MTTRTGLRPTAPHHLQHQQFAAQSSSFGLVQSGVTSPSVSRGAVDARRSRSLSQVTSTLDETIASVMNERMESLAGLRSKIEELADLQQRESDRFLHAMRSVVTQSRATRDTISETETELTAALKRERDERARAVEIVTKFKSEGAAVMRTLKQKLQDLQVKHDQTAEENKRLRAEVQKWHHQALASGARSASGPPASAATPYHQRPSMGTSSSSEHAQIATLTRLLEDQDTIVEELQDRRRGLERRLAEATRERDRLVNVEPVEVPRTLLDEFSRTEALNAPHMPEERLRQLVQALLRRLKGEQIQRLRVEEQSARLASSQDQTIRRLEGRIRELESSAYAPMRTANGVGISAGGDAAGSTPHSHVASSALQLPKLTAVQLAHGPRFATNPDSSTAAGSGGAAVAGVLHEDVSAASSTLVTAQSPSGALAPAAATSRVPSAMTAAATTAAGGGRASVGSHLPSLEEQLQAVSAEFQASLHQWQAVVASDAEFLPDSP